MAKESVSIIKNKAGNHTKIKTSETAKDCRPFTGVVNYLSISCPSWQRILKPVYDLPRNSRLSYGTKMHQRPFKKTKNRHIQKDIS